MDTLANLRERVFACGDWAPTAAPDTVAKCNREINAAVGELYLLHPELFRSETFRFFPLAPTAPESETDTVSVASSTTLADPWVLERDTTNADLEATSLWPTDGSLSGAEIEVEDASGVTHIRTILDVWTTTGLKGGGNRQFLTIDQPWPDQTAAGMSWKIRMRDYPLPARFQNVTAVYPPGNTRAARFLPEVPGRDAEYSANYVAATQYAFGVGWRHLPRPTYRPRVTLGGNNTWVGPQPPGTYEFCYTQSLGIWDPRIGLGGPVESDAPTSSTHGPTQYRRTEPLLESAPSPISAQVTTDGAQTIIVGLPDRAFELGFGDPDTHRYHRQGVRTRIYVRAVEVDYSAGDPGAGARPTGYAATALPGANVQGANGWHLLDIVQGYAAEYTWAGAVLPDVRRKLPPAGVHRTLRFSPDPGSATAAWTVVGPVRPAELVDDTEALDVPPPALPVIAAAAAMRMAPTDEPGAYARAERAYSAAVRRLLGGMASAIPNGQPVSRSVPRRGHHR